MQNITNLKLANLKLARNKLARNKKKISYQYYRDKIYSQ